VAGGQADVGAKVWTRLTFCEAAASMKAVPLRGVALAGSNTSRWARRPDSAGPEHLWLGIPSSRLWKRCSPWCPVRRPNHPGSGIGRRNASSHSSWRHSSAACARAMAAVRKMNGPRNTWRSSGCRRRLLVSGSPAAIRQTARRVGYGAESAPLGVWLGHLGAQPVSVPDGIDRDAVPGAVSGAGAMIMLLGEKSVSISRRAVGRVQCRPPG